MTNYLVTGGCGFIGSAFLRRFVPQCPNDRFLNVDLLTYAGNQLNVAAIRSARKYCFEQVDVANASAMDQVFRMFLPDVVVHFAAESHVDRSIDGPAPFMRTNVDGTFVLLECCRRYWGANQIGKRFHQVSTDEVYGSVGFEDAPKREEDAYDPSSPYSASKAAADHLVRAWGRTFGLHYTISIACNNYGPYQLPEKLIPRVICRALRGESIPVFGDGKNRREWIYVDDHVEAIWKILHGSKTRVTYNVGSGFEAANIDLVRSICKDVAIETEKKYSEIESLIEFVSDRPGHDLRYALDSRRFLSDLSTFSEERLLPDLLGVRSHFGHGRSLSTGLVDTLIWYMENPEWIASAQNGSYQ